MRSDERSAPALRTAGRGIDEAEGSELRATCRRQAAVIDALARAIGALRSGAIALKAENAELRSERRRLHQQDGDDPLAGASGARIGVEEQVALGVNAPARARRVVAAALVERVAASVIERAKLTISELVTNSVRHGGVTEGGYAVVRLQLSDKRLRLEVEDPGRGGAVSPRGVDTNTCGGFGLHVVETVSERWGSERCASGALRVWAELSLDPTVASKDAPARNATPQRGEEVHVVPEPRAGTWSVYLDAMDAALSEHPSQTDAEAAARAQAALRACRRIVVHDRYFRTRLMSLRAVDACPRATEH
jgi:anti-sigma regulatory factor (Ser/Thr protein kinase)